MTGPASLKARYRAASRAMIVAHRGIWSRHPENSLPAIVAAAEFDIVEIDARIAADAAAVLMHDATLARTTGDPRGVSDLSSAETTALRLREGAGGEGTALTEATVPTLAAALAAGPSLLFDLDAKDPVEAEAVARAAVAAGGAGRAAIKVKVADMADVAALTALEARTGLAVNAKVDLVGRESLALIDALRSADVAVAEVWFDDLDLLAEAARRAGGTLLLSSYTLDPVHCMGLSDSLAARDPDAVWGRLVDAGLRIVMTDRPAELRAWLDGRMARSA